MKSRRGKRAKIRILLVDDHPSMLEYMRMRLRRSRGIVVIATAISGDQAVCLASRHRPEVVVMDCTMPGRMPAFKAARLIMAHLPEVLMIGVCENSANADTVRSMFKAGAAGIISKANLAMELAPAIRTVWSGDSFVGASLVNAVVKALVRPGRSKSRKKCRLSNREKEVLAGTKHRDSAKNIALRLKISHRTVEGVKTNLHHKGWL